MITNATNNINFLNNLKNVHNLIPIMIKLEKLFNTGIETQTYKFDAIVSNNVETYKIHVTKNKSILIESYYIGDNSYPFCRSILSMNLNGTSNSNCNFIGYGYIDYYALNNTIRFLGAEKYEISKPYIHDSGKYFQYLTLYDLPPEDFFILGTEIINRIDMVDSYFPYFILYFSNSILYDIENLTYFLNSVMEDNDD